MFAMGVNDVPLAGDKLGGLDPVSLATHHFNVLNNMSTQKWFVANTARQKVIDAFVDFIDRHGAPRFDELAKRQETATNGWSNNIAFRKCLERESREENCAGHWLKPRLMDFAWIAQAPSAARLIGKAARCARSDWVEFTVSHIDGLDLSPSGKIALLDSNLTAALEEQGENTLGGEL